jgi:Ca2+-binding RTX toxin-like protein
VTGSSGINNIVVVFNAPTTFSAAGWTFGNWVSGVDRAIFSGSGGKDKITGSSQSDLFNVGAGGDSLDAGDSNDIFGIEANLAAGTTLQGGAGTDDVLNVGGGLATDLRAGIVAGVERLNFAVDLINVTTNGDHFGAGKITRVSNNANEVSTLSVLDDSVDLRTVTFDAPWDLDDNVVIVGTSSLSNVLFGSSENDTIQGSGNSSDLMTGGGGKDTLLGGLGPDNFRYFAGSEAVAGEVASGGAGKDAFSLIGAGVIDLGILTATEIETLDFVSGNSAATLRANQFGGTEILAVSGSGGVDQIVVNAVGQAADLSKVAFTFWTNGTDAVAINGSASADTLVGSSQNDTLDGKAGDDVMTGGLGNDVFRVGGAGDVANEAAGQGSADRVIATASHVLKAGSEIELFTTNSGAGTAAINLTGNEVAQEILGNAGANRLEGKGAADTLRGFAGADTFVFATKLGGGNIDNILDFNPADDRFLLSDNIFTALNPGTILAGNFRANKTGLAQDASDRIIYDTDDGKLFYDEDGIGGVSGIRFGTVGINLAITNADFVVS